MQIFSPILALCIGLASLSCTEQRKTLIPREVLFGNPEKTSPGLSPDGNKLAYLAPDKKNVLNIWVRDLTNLNQSDKQVTSEKKRGIPAFLWQYDNAHLLYMQDANGDENTHIYQTDLNTNETKDLTPWDGVKCSILDYSHKFPDVMLIEMNKRDKSLFDVYKVNLKTGELTLEAENPDRVLHWITDHDLNIRGCLSYTKEGSLLVRIRDHANDPWREFLLLDPEETGGHVEFTADNKSLYVLASIGGNTCRLLKYSLSGGEPEVLLEDPDFDLTQLMMHPTTNALEAVGVDREKWNWIVLEPKIAKDFEKIAQIEKGVFSIASRTLSDQKWIIVFLSDQKPARYYLYDRDTQKSEFIFSAQPALEKYKLAAMQPISFQAHDGMTIHGYLTLPPEKDASNLPTVLLVHGGPWMRDSWGLKPSVQWLANRGYAVLQINYRGSEGYGKKYLNAGNKEWAGKMHTDLLDGKKWMIEKGYADPGKVAIYGGSYGGYAALVGLAFTPDEFCCGVDIVGPSNLVTLLQTVPPYWGPVKVRMERRMGSLETEQEFLKSRSPLYKAEFIKKPLLIGQGANDPRVKQAESDQIVAAMRDNQLPVEYLLFSDEGHGFARPENRLKFFAAAEEFLSKYLGGACEPPTAEESWESLKR